MDMSGGGQKQGETVLSLGRIEKGLIRQQEVVKALEDRLSWVLRPAQPAPVGSEGQDGTGRSELRTRLLQYSDAIGGTNCRLQELLDRLDL